MLICNKYYYFLCLQTSVSLLTLKLSTPNIDQLLTHYLYVEHYSHLFKLTPHLLRNINPPVNINIEACYHLTNIESKISFILLHMTFKEVICSVRISFDVVSVVLDETDRNRVI